MNVKQIIKFNYKQIFKTPFLIILIVFLFIGILETFVTFMPKENIICFNTNIKGELNTLNFDKNIKILKNVKNKDDCDKEVTLNINEQNKNVYIESDSTEIINNLKSTIETNYNLKFVPKDQQLKFNIKKIKTQNYVNTAIILGIVLFTSMILGQLMYISVATEKINKISLMTQYFIDPIKLIFIKLGCFISIIVSAILIYVITIFIFQKLKIIMLPSDILKILSLQNLILFIVTFIVTAIMNSLIFIAFASKVSNLDNLPFYSFFPVVSIMLIFFIATSLIFLDFGINQLVYIPYLTMLLLPLKIANYNLQWYEVIAMTITNAIVLFISIKKINKIFKKR